MQLRNVRDRKTPELIIIPMIDIMFFLLVFFMLSTMYMIDLKTIPVKLPQAAHAATDTTTTFAVSLKNDGSLYLGDAPTDIQSLITQSSIEQKNNPRFAIVIRARMLITVVLLNLLINLKAQVLPALVWQRMELVNNEFWSTQ